MKAATLVAVPGALVHTDSANLFAGFLQRQHIFNVAEQKKLNSKAQSNHFRVLFQCGFISAQLLLL